ncbi:MAG TPA: 5'/3'-nucleotidase SurE [Bacteroidales bacterium]|nr:5'/3'-nucleotidase SurE [Bacteroidales bacterium]
MGNDRRKPLILVTNDDGYKAKGLKKLIEIANEFGEVVVIAANESQSARSHAITIKDPIKYKVANNGLANYIIKGTPVDGVKLAICSLLDRKPDLILSGINHGTNSSSSVVYSGTMAAALEGAIHGVPSIGFSLLDYHPDADFEPATNYIKQLISNVLASGLPQGTCLNVNIPIEKAEAIKGIRICRQSNGYWIEKFDTREDPRGSKYSWLTGKFVDREPESEDTDEWALRNNYISVVPVKTDLTAHDMIQQIKHWEKESESNEKKQI